MLLNHSKRERKGEYGVISMQRRKASDCWEIVVSGKSTRDRMCVHPFLMDVSALCVGEYVFV